MVIGILAAKEHMAIVILYPAADSAGIIVNRLRFAGTLGFEGFFFLCLSCVAVGSEIAIWLVAYRTNCLLLAGSRRTLGMDGGQCTVRHCADLVTILGEELTAGITGIVGIPALFGTVGFLCCRKGFIGVRAGYRYLAGCYYRIICLCGNGCGAPADSHYLTVAVYGYNAVVAGTPNDRIGRICGGPLRR